MSDGYVSNKVSDSNKVSERLFCFSIIILTNFFFPQMLLKKNQILSFEYVLLAFFLLAEKD